jgi:outer membrane receptor for ferrienterochelin and colicins
MTNILFSSIVILFVVLGVADVTAQEDSVAIEELQEVKMQHRHNASIQLSSPFAVKRIKSSYFQKNPTPNLTEAIALINGIQAQQNCNVCNTNEIKINGMAGPYTLVLIDDMPIVSALSSVYGLNSIPMSIIDNIEVSKGPSDVTYPSEAMGGVINIKTKSFNYLPKWYAEVMGTSWGEYNIDFSTKSKWAKSIEHMISLNYFNFTNRIDKNNDGFTDMSLQDRISVFNKWVFRRDDAIMGQIAARYMYEERFGGEMKYQASDRGKATRYGESIFTNRLELIGQYNMPTREDIKFNLSYNYHDQNSYYGIMPYMATQHTSYNQLIWRKKWLKNLSTISGVTFRVNSYDDNTAATALPNGKNKSSTYFIPGMFAQSLLDINHQNNIALGVRVDYHDIHGLIYSPRVAYKWHNDRGSQVRLNLGKGFRVINLFSEEHAALTGSRIVEVKNELQPEVSYNTLVNFNQKLNFAMSYIDIDVDLFHNYFNNKIIADYDTDPNKIIFDNLKEYAVVKGIGVNTAWVLSLPISFNLGATYVRSYSVEEDDFHVKEKIQPVHTPQWQGANTLSYKSKLNWNVDITHQWTGRMRLPILEYDYRPEYSPLYHILNIKISKIWKRIEVYAGLKNILNFTPISPLMRSWDPFDKYVNDTINNPNGYTFDASYTYASMQGRRMFLGVRWSI